MAEELPAIKWMCKQRCVYWGPVVSTGAYKKKTYAAPIEIACRWDDEEKLLVINGKELISQSKIISDRLLEKEGVLTECSISDLQDLDDPFAPTNPKGWRIVGQARTPDIRAKKCLYENFV